MLNGWDLFEAFRVALPILLLGGARLSLPAPFFEVLRGDILQSEIFQHSVQLQELKVQQSPQKNQDRPNRALQENRLTLATHNRGFYTVPA